MQDIPQFIYNKNRLLKDINNKPLVLKYTNSPYKNNNDENYDNILIVKSFFMENFKKFTWLNQFHNTDLFVYNNPLQSYDF